MNSPTHRLRVGYLAGSGHTGSTLLSMFMDTHPQVASVGETAVKPSLRRIRQSSYVCSCGTPVGRCGFWRELFKGINREGYDVRSENWLNDYRYDNRHLRFWLSQYSSNTVIRVLQDLAADRLPFHRQRMRQADGANIAFVRSVLQVTKRDVFFDASKDPFRLARLLRLPELDVRVVLLVRDVRGFCSSAKRRGDTVHSAARTWLNTQDVLRKVISKLPAHRVTLLRYEDLCAEPCYWLKELQRFLEVDVLQLPDIVISQEHHVLGNRIRKSRELRIRQPDDWRQNLTATEAAAALRIAGSLNRHFGYA